MLFRYLVQSVIEYGVEIWRWEEKAELERIMYDYVRWIFGLEFCTRDVMARELGMRKLKGWGLKARRYKERLRLGRAKKIA